MCVPLMIFPSANDKNLTWANLSKKATDWKEELHHQV